MDELFECPECRSLHAEPADARLGLRVLCLDCELQVVILSVAVAIDEEDVREAA